MFDNPYLLIAFSVLMHVAWNLMARQIDRKANFLWWGLLTHLVLLGPYALWQLIQNASWSQSLVMLIICSAVANAIYFVALRRAYHYAPVSLVYPLARSSPILIALWLALFFNQTLSVMEWIAITVGVLGLWLLADSSKQSQTKQALPWTALAALATSIYSISDKFAVNALPGFSEQLGFISIGYALSFLTLTYFNKQETGHYKPLVRPQLIYIVIGGLFIGTAYALVVRAMLYLPAAHVVAFTNAGIVLAVGLSIFVFNEKEHWPKRCIGAGIVVLGLLLL